MVPEELQQDTVIVTVNPLPTANAGNDDRICFGGTIVLGAPAPGGFTYAWTSIPAGFTSTQADPTVAPIVTTQYFLTVTNSTSLCQNEANVEITVESPPVINAGNDENICDTQLNFTLTSASGPSSGVSYQWQALGGNGSFNNATFLNPTYTIGSNDINAGSVTFLLTAQNTSGSCSAITDQITLTIEGPVSVSAGANGVICETGYLLNSATAANATSVVWSTDGDGTFNDNLNINTTYNPGTNDINSGSVNLTLTATNNCGSEQNTIVKTIVDTPTANAGSDITISQGATADLSGVTANASSVLWTAPAGSGTLVNSTSEVTQFISDPAEVGPITLTLTAEPFTVDGTACGTAASNSLTIFINLPPTADAGEDRDICLK